MTITPKEKRQLVRLLSELEEHLESAIDTTVLEDGSFPENATDDERYNVKRDRRLRRQAEDWIMRLDGKPRKKGKE